MFDNNGSFLLAMFEFFIFFAYLMCLFWIFSDLFRDRHLGGWGKFFWILFIIILPLLGMLVYLIARGGGMQQRSVEQAAEIQKTQDTYIKSVVANQGAGSVADQIASAKALLDSGAISQAEFDQIKAKALA
ncbi:MAG: SHOCT domain-containing protein [Dermatophilaceae bacterium]